MKMPTQREAKQTALDALRSAGIGMPSELNYPLDCMTALELSALASWVREAWNNGFAQGQDAQLIASVYPPGVHPPQPLDV